MKDFFISYNGKDKQWAEWIAWTLEEAGYSTVIQAWDFLAGGNFILEMQEAAVKTKQTVAVLSENYLSALYTKPEWAAAFLQDPTGDRHKLIPVRIDNCHPDGMLAAIIYIDLYGLDSDSAKGTLLNKIKLERGKPDAAPGFPGGTFPARPVPNLQQPATVAQPRATTINWETLSGPQQGEFVHALLTAYSNRSSLEQMMLFEMDVRLSQIAGSGNMREVTASVVTWAVDNGRIKELFEGARARNPGNHSLRQLEAKLLSMAPTDARPQSETASTRTPQSLTDTAPNSGSHVGGDDISVGDISDTSGVAIGENATVNVTNIYNSPEGSSSFPSQDPTSAVSGALDIWREKLEFLLQQEAITADAAQKFALKRQIEEAKAKILELS